MTARPVGPREHLSAPGDRRSLPISLLALAAGPAAWILQLVVDYGVASDLCRRNGVPRAAPPISGWAPEQIVLVAVNLICLALALAGGFAAVAGWRRTRTEKPGGASERIAVGEERARFLAACGMMTAAVFALAILFDTASPFFIPSCWRFTP